MVKKNGTEIFIRKIFIIEILHRNPLHSGACHYIQNHHFLEIGQPDSYIVACSKLFGDLMLNACSIFWNTVKHINTLRWKAVDFGCPHWIFHAKWRNDDVIRLVIPSVNWNSYTKIFFIGNQGHQRIKRLKKLRKNRNSYETYITRNSKKSSISFL